MIRRLRHDPTWWFSLQIPLLRAPAACWWARAIVESTEGSVSLWLVRIPERVDDLRTRGS